MENTQNVLKFSNASYSIPIKILSIQEKSSIIVILCTCYKLAAKSKLPVGIPSGRKLDAHL